jgi:hypothetical protein
MAALYQPMQNKHRPNVRRVQAEYLYPALSLIIDGSHPNHGGVLRGGACDIVDDTLPQQLMYTTAHLQT